MEESVAEAGRRWASDKRVDEAEAETVSSQLRSLKEELKRQIDTVASRVDHTDRLVNGVEKEWSDATSDGLRSLHASVQEVSEGIIGET